MGSTSTDSRSGKYVGSRMSTDTLKGKLLGFSIVCNSLLYLGYTKYLLCALAFRIPVAENRPHYLIRHRSPYRHDIFLSPGNTFYGVDEPLDERNHFFSCIF